MNMIGFAAKLNQINIEPATYLFHLIPQPIKRVIIKYLSPVFCNENQMEIQIKNRVSRFSHLTFSLKPIVLVA